MNVGGGFKFYLRKVSGVVELLILNNVYNHFEYSSVVIQAPSI